MTANEQMNERGREREAKGNAKKKKKKKKKKRADRNHWARRVGCWREEEEEEEEYVSGLGDKTVRRTVREIERGKESNVTIARIITD
jgi:ribosomal protein S8E